MKSLYNEEMVEKLNKKIKKSLLIGLLPLCVIIPLYVVFLIIVEMETIKLYQVLSSIMFTLWGWTFIFELSFNVLPAKKRCSHINSVLKNNEIEVTGTVTEISDPITLERSIMIREVLIVKGYERHKVYYNIDLNEFNISLNDEIKVILVNNFVKEYEVM